MTVFYFLAGTILLIAGIVDFIWTTLWVDGGAGPITKKLSALIWKVMRKVSKDRSKILSLAGPLMLFVTLLSWIALIWTGWTLIFASDPSSFSDTEDNGPVSWANRIYFAGYLVFTLGNGDYSPHEGFWQIASVLATGTGLIFITLGVTYFLSVLGAVSAKHAFSESVSGLGENSSEVVLNAWNGKDFHNIDLLLNTYASQMSMLTAQHNAYPILHYYHADQDKEALPSSVALLDEALTLFICGIRDDAMPNKLLIKETRFSINSYLETLLPAYVKPSENSPSSPDLNILREAGLPTVSDDIYQENLTRLDDRRKSLLGMVQENARKWPGE